MSFARLTGSGFGSGFILDEGDLMSPSRKVKLTSLQAICVIVGCIVGSGLFVAPGDVFYQCGSVGLGLLAWLTAGVIAIIGALNYAELGTAIPRCGGEYAYYLDILGAPAAFAFAWLCFWIQCPCILALLSITFARYSGSVVFGIDPKGEDLDASYEMKLVAIGACILTGITNSFGFKNGAAINSVLTSLKMLSIIAILGLGCWLGLPQGLEYFKNPFAPFDIAIAGKTFQRPPSLKAFGLSIISCLWGFDGWNILNFMAGNLYRPHETLPKLVTMGLGSVIIIVLTVNVAFLIGLGPSVVAKDQAVAITLGEAAFGAWGGWIMACAIALNVFGVLQTALMSFPEVYGEAARSGLFPKFLVTDSGEVALPAIWAPICLAVGFILAGDFTVLTQVYGTVLYCFYALSVCCIFLLRHRGTKAPYQVVLYPFLPMLFICTALVLVANAAIAAPSQSLAGILFVLLSVPFYYLFVHKDYMALVNGDDEDIPKECDSMLIADPITARK